MTRIWKRWPMATLLLSPAAWGVAAWAAGTHVQGERLTFALPDLDGVTFTSEDERFKGKVVLVDIWGTWCGPCRAELPHLIRIHEKYHGQGLEIVGIAFESGPPESQRERLKEFVRREKVPYLVLHGGSRGREVNMKLPALQNFEGFPTKILIGRDGRVQRVSVGFTDDRIKELEGAIADLLKG